MYSHIAIQQLGSNLALHPAGLTPAPSLSVVQDAIPETNLISIALAEASNVADLVMGRPWVELKGRLGGLMVEGCRHVGINCHELPAVFL